MAFDYAQNGESGNRVGLHYSTFRPFPSKPPLQIKDLLREDFQTGGRIREVGVTLNLAHQRLSDLQVFLRDPGGVAIQLMWS